MSGEACRDAARELLPFYLNGSLESEEAAAVRSHLESCATCSLELDELSQLATAIESHGTLDPAPARRRPLLLAVVAAVPVLALIVWAYLSLGTPPRTVVMDLGSGPARDPSASPFLEVSGEQEVVRFVFFVPVSPGARYSAEIRDANGSVLLPEQGLGPLDSLGRAHLEVLASRLGAEGKRELLAYREDDRSGRETYRFPFTLRLVRQRDHD